MSRMKLLLSALLKTLLGCGIMALLLFVPAGTLHYTRAWVLLTLLFLPMMVLGGVLLFKRPELLQRRLQSKEKRSTQQGVVKYSALLFMLAFVVAALDFRFCWSSVPGWLTHAASLAFLVGYALYAQVMRENKWLSRVIEVDDEQTVISTGMYGIVRHPMYTATLLMFLSMPLVLASWWSFAVLTMYIPIIVHRILDEENMLHAQLKGYDCYCQKLRWRLMPGIW